MDEREKPSQVPLRAAAQKITTGYESVNKLGLNLFYATSFTFRGFQKSLKKGKKRKKN